MPQGARGAGGRLDVILRPDPTKFAVQHKRVVFVTSHPPTQGEGA